MLDIKRVEEARKNVSAYLEDGLLVKVKPPREDIIQTYERNQKESIDIAKKLFQENLSNLWVVVCSYYSMFYIANLVLYRLGYKVGSKVVHKVTEDALIVYVREKLKKNLLEDYEKAKEEALDIIGSKTDEIIESFSNESEKRSIFQYETTEKIKRSRAKTSLERAKRFIFEMNRLL